MLLKKNKTRVLVHYPTSHLKNVAVLWLIMRHFIFCFLKHLLLVALTHVLDLSPLTRPVFFSFLM